jgi:hypothetical protein
MGLVTIALIIVAVWFGVLVIVITMFMASAHADADAERHSAEARDDVSTQSPAPPSGAAVGDGRGSIDAAGVGREAERLRIEPPGRSRCTYRAWLELVATVRDRGSSPQ